MEHLCIVETLYSITAVYCRRKALSDDFLPGSVHCIICHYFCVKGSRASEYRLTNYVKPAIKKPHKSFAYCKVPQRTIAQNNVFIVYGLVVTSEE